MPGEWDIAGNFLQGVMARRQHDQQMQMLEEQKGLLAQQKKELEARELLAKAESERKIKAGQEWEQVMSLFQGGGGQAATAQGEMPQMGIPQLMAIERLAKETGNINPFTVKEYQKNMMSPEGGSETLALGPWGNVLGRRQEYRPIEREFIDKTGAKFKGTINPNTGKWILPPAQTELSPKQSALETTQAAGSGAQAVLQQTRDMIKGIGLAKTALERATRGPELMLGATTQTNPDAALFKGFVEGTIGPLIRALGEKGALSEGDTKRALKLVPSLLDTEPIALQKVQQIEDIINAAGGKGKPSLGLGKGKKDDPLGLR